MITTMADMKLTDEFWDCECEKNYIHSKQQKTCPICKTKAENQPDSHLEEVLQYGYSIRKK